MGLTYHKPRGRRFTFSLLLLLTLLLLVLTGLGVFRLYFGFDWTAGEQGSGELFSLRIRGGNSFNLFEASYAADFWLSLIILIVLALALPYLRLVGGVLLSVAAAGGIITLHFRNSLSEMAIPLEFELLIVLLLLMIHILMSYVTAVRDRKRFSRLLSQYIPPELANAYSRDPDSMLVGEQREISVLFCDVVGFSGMIETLTADELRDWLNEFFSVTSRVVVRHRGTIDKYMGDSIMAIWGAPARSDTHAYDALCAAMDMHDELLELSASFQRRGLPSIEAGVGLSTGRANVGPMGSEFRMDYTVVGDAVNVAQRLEAQTRKYRVPIIVSGATAEVLTDMLFRELDTVQVKGRQQSVTMFQPLGPLDAATDQTRERLALHQKAMEASKAGRWLEATESFEILRDEWGPFEMYELYLRGIAQASR